MKSKLIVVIVIAAFSFAPVASRVSAQNEPCPAGHSCVDYHGSVIEIDPADGPYQAIVVEKRDITVTNLDGESHTADVLLAGFAQDSKGEFHLSQEYRVSSIPRFVNANVADVFVLTEATDANSR